ncbi:uncharacterized protein LOC124406210 [Diprion similis]|uniref:uncharacterized protein LOC124406210 n=1 Tax=Diprion similis TaxID=362088 RepID=UPI001EF7D85B|nr:uncharacterized protein LOC124406210 [Diprion similis]
MLLLEHHEVKEIVLGTSCKPESPAADAAETVKSKYEIDSKVFKKRNALAQLVLISSLNDTNIEVTATCNTAKETWEKLTSIYEQSSGQRVDRLLEQFFTLEKTVTEDIATHVGRLERNFRELNDEMKKLIKTELPDLLLMSRVMSTLPAEYFEFISVWESVSVEERTLNKLTERLRLIEMRLPNKHSESVALVAKSTKKTTQKKALKCFKCHKLGHYASKYPEKLTSKSLNAGSSENTLLEVDALVCTMESVKEKEPGAYVCTMEGITKKSCG